MSLAAKGDEGSNIDERNLDAQASEGVVVGCRGGEALQHALNDLRVDEQGDCPHEDSVRNGRAVVVPCALPAGSVDTGGAQPPELVGDEIAFTSPQVACIED